MHLPKVLSKKRYDDPDVIARFNRLMDAILAAIPNLDVNFLSIGNEVDLGFANDKKLWKQYRVFYRGTKDFVKKRKPDWKVGIAMTLYGLTQQRKELAQTLNRHSDIILVSYYPINSDFTVKDPRVVGEEMGAVVKAYPHRTIYFSEAGYPSSPVLGSSEERQSEFVREVFKAWDAHASQIRYLAFSWLTDSSPAALDFFAKYYSLADNKFREYLRTLGLRTNPGHGTDKPAFVALKAEAKARGW
jgi:hypothetical protein